MKALNSKESFDQVWMESVVETSITIYIYIYIYIYIQKVKHKDKQYIPGPQFSMGKNVLVTTRAS